MENSPHGWKKSWLFAETLFHGRREMAVCCPQRSKNLSFLGIFTGIWREHVPLWFDHDFPHI